MKIRWDAVGLAISGVAIVSAYLLNSVFSSISADWSPEYQSLQQKIKTYQNENMEIQDQVYHYEALTTIASEAAAEGFVYNPNNIIYIK